MEAPRQKSFFRGCLIAVAWILGIAGLLLGLLVWVAVATTKDEPYDPRKDPDPGVQAALHGWTQNTAPITSANGVFLVQGKINETISLDFVVDSGASDVVLPMDTVSTLIRSKTILPTDFLPGQSVTMGDGTVAPHARFTLHSLQVGGQTLKNVTAIVGGDGPSAPLLLGQSFLSKFHWRMENRQLILDP